jgi:hypothetical protein
MRDKQNSKLDRLFENSYDDIMFENSSDMKSKYNMSRVFNDEATPLHNKAMTLIKQILNITDDDLAKDYKSAVYIMVNPREKESNETHVQKAQKMVNFLESESGKTFVKDFKIDEYRKLLEKVREERREKKRIMYEERQKKRTERHEKRASHGPHTSSSSESTSDLSSGEEKKGKGKGKGKENASKKDHTSSEISTPTITETPEKKKKISKTKESGHFITQRGNSYGKIHNKTKFNLLSQSEVIISDSD